MKFSIRPARLHLAVCLALGSVSLPGAAQWSGLVEARVVRADAPASWTRSGLGKLRYDASNDGLRLGQALLRGDIDLSDTLSGTLVLSGADDRNGLLDVNEAWLRWSPIRSSSWKHRVQLGAFFPALSLENDGPGWSTTRTISSSAINSWIGEELRAGALELSTLRRGRMVGSAHDFGLTGAVFGGNDPTGTLLAWRGWSVSERITGLSEELVLADLPVYAPGGQIARQWRQIQVFRELDSRAGYYVGAHYGYDGALEVSAMQYDNRADPMVIRSGQYGWRTKFRHISAHARLGRWELLAQAMDGSTFMGPNAVALDMRAWYLLAGHPLGKGSVALRYDQFSTYDTDILPSDPNQEHGRALALAYSYPIAAHWTLISEVLLVESTRAARAQIGEPVRAHERSFTSAVRWTF